MTPPAVTIGLLTAILPKLNKGDCPDNKWPDSKGEYWPLCPFHNDTHSGSFNVSECGYNCFACDAKGGLKKLAQHLGVEVLQCCSVDEGDNHPPPPPLTVEEYAKYKKLPAEYLQGLGLETIHIKGKSVVKIPYYDGSGNEAVVRFRLTLRKGKKDNRFRWRSGSKGKLIPYGLWKLDDARAAGYVLIFEGESDCHTAWYHGLPAIGTPGANNWRDEWSEYLTGLTAYVWQEPDTAGGKLVEKLGKSVEDLRVITAPGSAKDISEAYLLGVDIQDLIRRLTAAARPFAEIERERLNTAAQDARKKAGDLLDCPNILERVDKIVTRLGLVGESNNAKLLYLAVTSRLMQRPVNIVIKGPSSAGKSFTVETVLKLFPDSAFYALSSMSERALAYSEEPLQHRFLVLFEAAGMTSDFGTYLIRTLLSEGCIRYETVEKTQDGLKPKLIEREGPTGLIVTTTAVKLHPENETRIFSITAKDDPHQTRAVFEALANRVNGKGATVLDLSRWHALQEWLTLAGVRDVNIPFAHKLAEHANAKAVRLRRDFGALLTLIATHAMLHQTHRQRDKTGRIIATVEDYATVYEIIKDVITEGVEATVKATVRETVDAVATITPKPVSVTRLATALELDKSATSRRVREALSLGYLVNHEDKRGKPYRLDVGESMPQEEDVIPAPAVLLGGEGVSLPPAQHCNTATPLPEYEDAELLQEVCEFYGENYYNLED